MEQVNRGIFRAVGRDSSDSHTGNKKSIVLVRPFDFNPLTHDSYSHGRYVPGVIGGIGYPEALETAFYTDYGHGDVFVFEDKDKFDSTQEGLEEFGVFDGRHNVYFVPISPGESSIEGRSSACFPRVSKFLRNLSGRGVDFAGGPIKRNGKLIKTYSGCLGEVFQGLRREGIRGSLLRDVCFTQKSA
jgi:hypothetical protein